MTNGRRIDLTALFGDLQAELASRLGTARKNIQHPGAKGGVTEAEWMSLLSKYLPTRYAATKGFVVDSSGHLSDEIDIIVHDRHFSPLLFHRADTCYVPAESVYAIFEVKPELCLEHIRYAGAKAASVRSLYRTSATIPHAGGTYEARLPPRLLAGILTSSSGWSPPSSGLESALSDLELEQQIDIGCSANDVAFCACYTQDGLEVDIAGPGEELVFFLFQFLRSLQAIGSVPAINYGHYLRAMKAGEPSC